MGDIIDWEAIRLGGMPAFEAALPALSEHAERWAAQLEAAGELASKLVQFCKLKIE